MSELPRGSGSQGDSKSQQRNISGRIRVDGEIRATIPQKLIEEYRTSGQDENKREKYRVKVETATLVCVFLVAILTLIQTGQTIRATSIAAATLGSTKDANRRDLRPYVYASKLEGSGEMLKGEPVSGIASISNSGKTPAINVHGCADFATLSNGSPISDDYPCPNPMFARQTSTLDRSNYVLGPGATSPQIQAPPTMLAGIPVNQSPEKIGALFREQKLRLYFYGYIYYSDLAEPDKVLRTTFCGIYNIDTHAYDICANHNKMM